MMLIIIADGSIATSNTVSPLRDGFVATVDATSGIMNICAGKENEPTNVVCDLYFF